MFAWLKTIEREYKHDSNEPITAEEPFCKKDSRNDYKNPKDQKTISMNPKAYKVSDQKSEDDIISLWVIDRATEK